MHTIIQGSRWGCAICAHSSENAQLSKSRCDIFAQQFHRRYAQLRDLGLLPTNVVSNSMTSGKLPWKCHGVSKKRLNKFDLDLWQSALIEFDRNTGDRNQTFGRSFFSKLYPWPRLLPLSLDTDWFIFIQSPNGQNLNKRKRNTLPEVNT